MSSSLPSVINMVNTAFGVTVLAVPYCFHQCGITLGILLLVIASYISKRSCCLLLRSAQISRKRNFEALGLHVEGFLGKFVVEMSLIGYLGGTCIAWFVVIGDVAPAVFSSALGIEKTWTLRTVLIIVIGVGAVLPLSLIKDINSLSSASNVAIGIYAFFVSQLFLSALPTIIYGEWVHVVNFWKPSGMFQCLPIFVISFLCQTVVFVIYEALTDPTVKKMENIVNSAMDTLLFLSITVGFCGYVVFYQDGMQGDLLNNYGHDFISEFIRLGFCISTVLSFPLLVFPCRLSINSMLSSAKSNVEGTQPIGSTYIPPDKFLSITCSLIVGTLILGILFPNVEFVMALVGATMGASLTYILPSYIYLKVAEDEASKTEAKVMVAIGIFLLCMSTFTVLSMSESHNPVVKMAEMQPLDHKVNVAVSKAGALKNISTFGRVIKAQSKAPEAKLSETNNRNLEEKRFVKRKDEENLKDAIKTLKTTKTVEVVGKEGNNVNPVTKQHAALLLPKEKTNDEEKRVEANNDVATRKDQGVTELEKEGKHMIRKRSAEDPKPDADELSEVDVIKPVIKPPVLKESSNSTINRKLSVADKTEPLATIRKELPATLKKLDEKLRSIWTSKSGNSQRQVIKGTRTTAVGGSDIQKKKESRTHLQ